MPKMSKTRKLAAHRELRRLATVLDSVVHAYAGLDTVDLIHNLNKLDTFVDEYRKLLVLEARDDQSISYDGNTVARRFRDKFFDNGKTFDGTVAGSPELGA